MSNTSTIPVTVNWRALSSSDAHQAWNDLTEWVRWLVDRYGLPVSVVPTCWFAHPVFVEELSALHTAWQAAYVVTTRSPTAGVEWHNQFGHCRRRLSEWLPLIAGQCAGGRTHVQAEQAPRWDSDLLRETAKQYS